MTAITRREAAIALATLCATAPVPRLSRPALAGDRLPGKSQRIIVPFAPGGTADGLGRVVAEILNDSLDARFEVDNRSGRNGSVGAEIAARAPPDGQTLLLGTLGTAVTNRYLYRHLDYDSEQSFMPVALIAEVANVLLVHPTFPANTLGAFVDRCKRQGPNRLSYASPGVGSAGHLFMEHFQSQAGLRISHAAHDGCSRMIRHLLTGQGTIAMDILPPYLAHLRSGALRPMGLSSAKRCDCAPDVASIAEQGYPAYEATFWWYVAAPAGTRLSLVKTLSGEILKGIAADAAIQKIRAGGATERLGDADELARHIAGERTKWKRVIDSAQLEPQ